jgi:hypothetical protein
MKKLFGTSEDAEKEGVWIDYGDIRVKVARAGGRNVKYQKVLEAESKPHKRALQTDSMPEDQARAMLMRVYSKTVVLDWENVDDGEGNIIPCTEENILAMFKEFPDFFLEIKNMADGVALFRDEELDADAKN